MPNTLLLKNIPDDIYERLRMAAQRHRRSLDKEVLVRLEAALPSARGLACERLARARQLRVGLGAEFNAADIDTFKKQGRP